MKISELDVSDGYIVELSMRKNSVELILTDWQEEKHTIIFKNVIGIESYSPEGVDLCQIKILPESERLKKVCAIAEENGDSFVEYSFISAWSDTPILRVFSDIVEID